MILIYLPPSMSSFQFTRRPKLVKGLRQLTVPNEKAKQQQMNDEKYKWTTELIFVSVVADQLTFTVKNYKVQTTNYISPLNKGRKHKKEGIISNSLGI